MIQLLLVLFIGVMPQQSASASPFGEGVYGADVPFGSLTGLAIALGGGGTVSMILTPSGQNLVGSASQSITITSTDVVGYKLYVNSPSSSSLTSGSSSIPASSNSSPGPLSVNSWGYNSDGSSNYSGVSTTNAIIKSASGPYKNGDITTLKYGVLVDSTKSDGTYTTGLTYTAVGQSY